MPKATTAILTGPTTILQNQQGTWDPTASSPQKGRSLVSGSIQWGDGSSTPWTGVPVLQSHTYSAAGTAGMRHQAVTQAMAQRG